jgi:hypothetical protein
MIHKYPQHLWAREIIQLINSQIGNAYKNNLLVDAPCGNGIIGNLVFHGLEDAKVKIMDIDDSVLNSPYNLKNNPNFSLELGDIFKSKHEGSDNIWLFINSLYCLPNTKVLMEQQSQYFKYIIAVVPNIEKKNFINFKEKNPNFPNPSLMKLDETIRFFESYNYQLKFQKSISKVVFHKWGPILDKMKMPNSWKQSLFTLLDKILVFSPGQYEIMLYERTK